MRLIPNVCVCVFDMLTTTVVVVLPEGYQLIRSRRGRRRRSHDDPTATAAKVRTHSDV